MNDKKVYVAQVMLDIQTYADTNKKICEGNGTPKAITEWSYDLLIALKNVLAKTYQQ